MKIVIEVDSPEVFNKDYFADWLNHHLNLKEDRNSYFDGVPVTVANISILETAN